MLVVSTDRGAVMVSDLGQTSQDIESDVLMKTTDISMMYSGILVIRLSTCM